MLERYKTETFDLDTEQVIDTKTSKEICVVTAYDGEPEDHEVRASRICEALELVDAERELRDRRVAQQADIDAGVMFIADKHGPGLVSALTRRDAARKAALR